MIGRSWPADRRRDEGFTLIELLVVMIILSILAAIAVPTIISQRGKARDTGTRTDLRTLQVEVTARLLDDPTPPTVRIVGDRYQVDGADVGAVSPGIVVAGPDPAVVDTTGWSPSAWCLSLVNAEGAVGAFKVSRQRNLEPGTCSSSTQP